MQRPEIITGAIAGDFRIGPLVAFGRHARIFAAQDGRGRPALLKFLRPTVRDHRAFRELLVRERRLVSRLNHPNIQRFRGRGELFGEPYYALELVAGLTLAEIDAGFAFDPWATSTTIELGRGLFGALAQAHALDIAHGAIDAEAIRIAPTGRIVVTGFGLAPLRCGTREQVEATRVDGTGLSFADDVAAAARIVLARIEPTGELKRILYAAHDARASARPRARELADVFRGLSVSPVPVGFSADEMSAPTEELPRPRALARMATVTEVAAVHVSVDATKTIATRSRDVVRPPPLPALVATGVLAAFVLGTVFGHAWVAG